MSANTTAGALLAGGQSRRMGRSKALLQWRGKSFWEIQLEKIRLLNLEPRLVVGPDPPEWLPRDFSWVPDDPGFGSVGPLAGLLALGKAVSTEHLFILGIDLPRFPTDFFLAQAGTLAPGQGWIPEIRGKLQPFAACYPQESLLKIEDFLRTGNNRVLSWVEPALESGILRKIQIPVSLEKAFANVNTPEDLEALKNNELPD